MEKGKYSLRVLFVLVLCIIFLTANVYGVNSWSLVSTSTIKIDDYTAGAPGITLAGFISETDGIAVGHHGEIYYTIDSGKHWTKAKYPPLCGNLMDSLEILDDNMAWSIGERFMRASNDGGKTWHDLPMCFTSVGSGHSISFVSPQIGWYATVSELFATNNGGQSWNPVSLPKVVNKNIMAIHRLNENIGYVLVNSGLLYQTDDGGKTWSSNKIPLNGRKPVSQIPHTPIEAVRFIDRLNGIIVLYAEHPRGFNILSTRDGGENWQEERLIENPKIGLGNIFLARDGKYLTIYDMNQEKILVFKRNN